MRQNLMDRTRRVEEAAVIDRDELVRHCLGLPGAYLDNPWGEEDSVVKVGGKIFCFLGDSTQPPAITVKNSREAVEEWRRRYPRHIGVPRYLNKQLWNSVALHGSGAPQLDEARELIEDSYALVVAALPKAKRPEPT
jgi:predicted DNA-binding protein (MmcQ/YjbR family)